MFRNVSVHWLRWMTVLSVLAACTVSLVPSGATADPLKDDSALKFAPSDVSFYFSGMRMREIFDKVAASNAIAKLKTVPSVQFGLAMAAASWENPPNPKAAMLKQMLADPQNQQLVELLKDAVSHEVFLYGGKNVGDAIALAQDINAAASAGQMEALAAGDFQNMRSYQVRKVVELLDQQGERLKIPTIVKGMKLSDTQKALDQLKRLETLIQGVLQQQPTMQGRFSREQLGGGEFLTLKLDGTLVPWPMVMSGADGVEPQQMQKLVDKLSALKLVISIGVRDSYLLISIGADNAHLGKLGQGDLLYDREEMAPIRKASDKPITNVGYVSAEFVNSLATVDRQVDQVVMLVKQFAPMLVAGTPDLQEELFADVDKLADYIKQSAPEHGDYSSFTYLTPEGCESFSYSWVTESPLDASQNLTILSNVGGDPIAFVASRGKSNPERIDALGTFLTRLAYYGEQIALQQLDETQVAAYEKLKTDLLPSLQRLGAATRDKLVPAFADGQIALVLDAKSKSDSWHVAMPPAQGELPMFELGIVLGVSDVNLAKEGFAEYFDIVQEVLDKLHEASNGDMRDMFPNPIPPIKLAKPASKEVSGGTVYYYALPESSGLDKQLAPGGGLSDKVMVLSLLPRFTARLLSDTPLEATGPLANTDRPLAAAFQLNFASLLDAIAPWIDYGLAISMAVNFETQPNPMGNIPQQVHDVVEVLKCFRTVSGVTYQEGKAIVTHSQWRFEDLQ